MKRLDPGAGPRDGHARPEGNIPTDPAAGVPALDGDAPVARPAP